MEEGDQIDLFAADLARREHVEEARLVQRRQKPLRQMALGLDHWRGGQNGRCKRARRHVMSGPVRVP